MYIIIGDRNCTYCRQSVAELMLNALAFVYLDAESEEAREIIASHSLGDGVFPKVFKEAEYIGVYTDLQEILDK